MDDKQVWGLDYRQPLDGIPAEILSILPLFDGRRTVAQVIQLTRLPRPTALELVQRLSRSQLLCDPVILDDPRAPKLDEWLTPPRRRRPLVFLGASLAPLVVIAFFLIKHKEIAPVAAVAVRPIAPPTVVAAPQPPVAVVPPPAIVVAAPAPVVAAPVAPAPVVAAPVAPAPVVAEKPAESYASLMGAAKKHLDQGKLGKALDESRRALELNDRGADAYLIVGTIQQQNGHAAEAKSAFKKYLELSPRGQFAGEIRSILKSL